MSWDGRFMEERRWLPSLSEHRHYRRGPSWLQSSDSTVPILRFAPTRRMAAREDREVRTPRDCGMQRSGEGCSASTDPGASAATVALLSDPVRAWFQAAFPQGPTPAQALAWPPIAAGEHVLLISPTGTGKTLAAFLAILDPLFRAREAGTLVPGLRCVYVSPLRSLNYDIERNLAEPLAGIGRKLELNCSPVRVGVRTGDTSAYERRKLRDDPPHVLITTPESLSLLLSQESWQAHWRTVEHVIVDEVHALAPTKRGADLAISLERVAAHAVRDPCRVGLSATCRADEGITRFLVGPSRRCRVIEAPLPVGTPPMEIGVECLIRPDEVPHRGLSYRRLQRRLRRIIGSNRTTVVFANTRSFAEKITHDLRLSVVPEAEKATMGRAAGRMEPRSVNEPDSSPLPTPHSPPPSVIAAHHSALDAQRRRAIESGLKSGAVRAVVTSTSLELGVDIGTADLTVQVGLPGGVSRCVQRVGRSGHRRGAGSRGLLLAATPGELVGALITARAALAGRVEPIRGVAAPLDVVCQQLVGMACAGEQSVSAAFEVIRKAGPMAELSRADFDGCLAFLAGELGAPAGAYEPEPGATPRWTSPRIWKRAGRFGIRNRRVARWFRTNVGTICSEESVRVLEDGVAVGTLEASYAERLAAGDRFVLDGRSLEVRRIEGAIVHARPAGGEPSLPRWTSDRQSFSPELASELAGFRAETASLLAEKGAASLRRWLIAELDVEPEAATVVIELFEAQEQWSEIPGSEGLLVEESPGPEGSGRIYTFHAPLHRAACEALARATGARLGRRLGRNLVLGIADLGWSIRLPDDDTIAPGELPSLLNLDRFAEDVLEGLDRGELLARRFRQVATTALMILRNPEPGRRVRVGGLHWASTRLYPLVRAACPDHPLLRQTRREVLEDVLDVPSAQHWLEGRPPVRFRTLPGLSPFAAAWIEPAAADSLHYESPDAALRRLHQRLLSTSGAGE
jgi:ATP-dependent Lhr-like helicase